MIRIGTRKSALALWQANKVKDLLEKYGHIASLVPLESSGEKDLVQPIYTMGIKGVFTKALDHALLNNKIDLAVHSLKDVPTLLPKEIEICAYLERGAAHDVIVYHPNFVNWKKNNLIGTGSLRRRAQWLRKYPNHNTENLRGNLQKRIKKLKSSNWGGAIFAQAGLERIDLLKNFTVLDWMIPAPGQGIIGVACLKKNKLISKMIHALNNRKTELCAQIERSFLNTLEGGCSAPIGAYANIEKNILHFHGGLFSLDGTKALIHKTQVSLENTEGLGKKAAIKMLNEGGSNLMKEIKNQLK